MGVLDVARDLFTTANFRFLRLVYNDCGPVHTVPESLVTTSSFAVMKQRLVADAY